MIRDLVIKNFQSHKESKLDFHNGFNSIIGTTDSGKSAIYRALYWIKSNKMSNAISFWNRKRDGSPIEETSATITTNEHSVSRKRESLLNAYVLDDEALEAVGRGDAPESVNKVLNLSDINFFSQHNPPFLLTESAGKVAELLNDLVHLSDIDRVLGNIDSAKRTTKRSLEGATDREGCLISSKEELTWVKEAQPLISAASATKEELESIVNAEKILSDLNSKYDSASLAVTGIDEVLSDAQPFLELIGSMQQELEEVTTKYSELARVVSSIKKLEENISILKSIDASAELEKCDNIQRELDAITDSLANFTDWIRSYAAKQRMVDEAQKEYDALSKELGAIPVCSECGRPLEDCND